MDEPISKSQRKRDAHALQELGVALTSLRHDILKTLPLGEPLYQAILEAQKCKSHGARRRQEQLIGKLMRRDDHEAIRHAYAQLQMRATSS